MSSYKIDGITPEGHALLFMEELAIPHVPPIDPYYICNRVGVDLSFERLEGADALLLREGGSALILLDSANRYDSRNNFSIAHELGHCYLPWHNKSRYSCTVQDIYRFRNTRKEEHEANRFASELLMPTTWLKQRIKKSDVSLSLIASIADKCKTSLTATAIKVVHSCSDRAGIVYSENNIVNWLAKSRSFPFELKSSGEVDERSVVSGFFRGDSLVEGVMKVPPSFWLSSPCPLEFIFEESLPMPHLNAALTLVTLPPDEDGDEWLDDDSW